MHIWQQPQPQQCQVTSALWLRLWYCAPARQMQARTASKEKAGNPERKRVIPPGELRTRLSEPRCLNSPGTTTCTRQPGALLDSHSLSGGQDLVMGPGRPCCTRSESCLWISPARSAAEAAPARDACAGAPAPR